MADDRGKLGLSRRTAMAAALGLALPGAAAAQPPADAGIGPPTPFGRAMERLGDQLLAATGLSQVAGNQLLSPWSIQAALGLLGLGARGRTEAELVRLLSGQRGDHATLAQALRGARLALSRVNGESTRIRRGEAGWARLDRGFLPEWQDLAREALNTRGRRLNFADPRAVPAINAWAGRETQGMIPRIVEALPSETEFLLTSAIHFEGRWANPFDPETTSARPFLQPQGGAAEVPMMRGEFDLAYGTAGPGHAVRLPYAGGRMALWVVTAERPEGSLALLTMLRQQGLNAYLRSVPFRTQRVQVSLPRFGFGGGADMLPALNTNGFANLLGGTADLRSITGRATAASAVLHQARIAVDERGTVAAAATAVIASRAMRLDIAEFTADRPFAFVLGLTGPFLPVFMGYVGDAHRAQA